MSLALMTRGFALWTILASSRRRRLRGWASSERAGERLSGWARALGYHENASGAITFCLQKRLATRPPR